MTEKLKQELESKGIIKLNKKFPCRLNPSADGRQSPCLKQYGMERFIFEHILD